MNREKGQNILSELKLDRFSSEQLHLQVQRQIREEIQAHQLEAGDKLPTSHELSAALKVSYETVQRAMTALADQGVVVRRPRKGTFVNRAPSSRTVGVFCTQTVFDPQASPSIWLIAGHLCDELRGRQRDAQIYYVPEEANSARTKAYRDLLRDLREHRLAGLIFLGYSPEISSQLKVMETARRYAIPAAAITPREVCSHTIWLDQLDYCRRGFRYLAERGCNRIALLSPTTTSQNSPLKSLREAAASEGIKLSPDDVFTPQFQTTAAALTTGERWGKALDLDRYDGALLCDDIVAVGFARSLRRRKVGVPEQLHVATMWNRGNPLHLALPFVRFEVDVEQWARRSVELLDTLIEGQEVDQPHCYMELEGPVEPEAAHALHLTEAMV